jgi:hypothetical protein
MDIVNIPNANGAASEKEKLEPLHSDESQASMENFLEEKES